MSKNSYPTIAENILHNFLEPVYVGTMVRAKSTMISDIQERSMFVCQYDEEQDILTFFTGQTKEAFRLIWKDSSYSQLKVLSEIKIV